MNKIVSNFYLIRLDGEPVYVGYTNRPIKTRFKEHLRDKDFGEAEPTVEDLGEVSYDFTWDLGLINSYAREVANNETKLIEEYGTRNSVWQKGLGTTIGGQTWDDIKYFVRTNRDNPKFRGLSEEDILAYLEEGGRASRYMQSFVSTMNLPEVAYMKNFVSNMNLPDVAYMKSFVSNMNLPEAKYISSFVSNMNLPEAKYISDFVNHMKLTEARYMSDFINGMNLPEVTYMNHFVSNMNLPAARYISSFVSNMNLPEARYMHSFVSNMKKPEDRYMSDFINGMNLPEVTYMNHFVSNMKKPIDK